MRFNDIAWAAFLDWYLAGKNNKYVRLFANKHLVYALRAQPSSVDFKDFYNKVVSDFLNSWGRMFIREETARDIYTAITDMNPFIIQIRGESLLECDLTDDGGVCGVIHKIYERLSDIWGINMTGISKIAHILNDSLFVLIDNNIREEYKKVYGISKSAEGYINWMRMMQAQAKEVVADFYMQGFTGSPEIFLSHQLGYDSEGCIKSIAKFLDEYYWLTITHGVPIPPKWIPNK